MKIQWIPQRSDVTKITYTQPETDVLSVNGEEYDFTDTSIIEYDVSSIDYVYKAYRENGTLHLNLYYPYSAEEKPVWENPNYYADGGYRGSQYEDYGTGVNLCE